MKIFIFLMFCGAAYANQLQEQLFSELLKKGQTDFSDVEIAFIAEGAADPDQLRDLSEAYNALLDRMALDPKIARQKGKKKAKTLYKLLFSILEGSPAEETGLTDLVKADLFNETVATFVFLDLVRRNGLVYEDYRLFSEGLDGYFFGEKEPSSREVVAAMITRRALYLADNRGWDIWKSLDLSKLLAPASTYGVNTLDRLYYNRVYQLYQAEEYLTGGYIAAGAANRFPNLVEFQILCLNLGAQLLKTTETRGDHQTMIPIAEALAAFTGEHAATLREAIATTRYNQVVFLYNKGRYDEALKLLEQGAIPKEQDGYRNMVVGSYVGLINRNIDAGTVGEAAPYLAKLEALDPQRAERMRTRISQLELKEVDESGDYAKALALASADLKTEVGIKNYLSVMTRYMQSLRKKGSFEEALTILDAVPPQLQSQVNHLRLNTYTAWTEQFPDEQYATLIKIYKRAFKDSKLDLDGEHLAAYRENYANALYREIEALVADRNFTLADQKSKSALKFAPNHAALKEQRKLVDTIMQRIGN